MSDTIVQFDFSEALMHLRAGKRVRRAKWVEFARIEFDVARSSPDIILDMGGSRMPWGVTRDAILATDWVLVEEDVRTEAVDAGK